MNPQNVLDSILMVAIFVLVSSAWTICVLLWVVQYTRRRKRFRQRMGVIDDGFDRLQTLQLWRDDYQARRGKTKRKRQSLRDRLETLRVNAGWKTPAHGVILAVGGVAAASCALTAVLGYGIWLGVAIGAGIIIGFWHVTRQRMAERITLFETQLVDSLRIAARALRAGHPLVAAFQAISEEIQEPVGEIFGNVCQEQALGLDLQTALRRAADAARDVDLKLLATAVSIQMDTGGNLADVMESLAAVMRARIRLNRRVRVLTASTRMSKNTLLVIPILLFVFLNIASPEYSEVFYTTLPGRLMLVGTAVSMVFGAWVMNKLSVLRY
jgi:tight adherence protein B